MAVSRRAAPSTAEASHCMQRVRQQNTTAEAAVRRELYACGLRYRVQVPVLTKPRRVADVAFSQLRVAVFIDGCFWHGCPEHATWPKANADFWRSKILANKERDLDTDRRLSGRRLGGGSSMDSRRAQRRRLSGGQRGSFAVKDQEGPMTDKDCPKQRQAIVDANVARIYGRVFSLPPPPQRLSAATGLWALAERIIPVKNAKQFNWWLLDLGGTICTAKRPACERCPRSRQCHLATRAIDTPSTRRMTTRIDK